MVLFQLWTVVIQVHQQIQLDLVISPQPTHPRLTMPVRLDIGLLQEIHLDSARAMESGLEYHSPAQVSTHTIVLSF